MATTALLRRIERETTEATAEAWEARRRASQGQRSQLTKWAADTLLATGAISADEHSAAKRYASLLERAAEGGRGDAEKVDGSGSDPHARAWDRAVSAEVARTVRSWVIRNQRARPSTARTLDLLCAFPSPSLERMRALGKGRLPHAQAEQMCRRVLEALHLALTDLDRGYGPKVAPNPQGLTYPQNRDTNCHNSPNV